MPSPWVHLRQLFTELIGQALTFWVSKVWASLITWCWRNQRVKIGERESRNRTTQTAPTHASCYGNEWKQSRALLPGRASHGGNIEVFDALIFLKQIFFTTWSSNCDEVIRGKWRWRPGDQLGCLCRVNLEITVAKGASFDITQSWVGMPALLLTRYVGSLFPFLKKLIFIVC